jgi:hypothetical protein
VGVQVCAEPVADARQQAALVAQVAGGVHVVTHLVRQDLLREALEAAVWIWGSEMTTDRSVRRIIANEPTKPSRFSSSALMHKMGERRRVKRLNTVLASGHAASQASRRLSSEGSAALAFMG